MSIGRELTAGSIAGAGNYFIGPGNTLTVGGNNRSTEVSGVIADFDPCGCPGPSGPGALVKTGTGTMILSGLNTYSGGTTFAGGIVFGFAEAVLGRRCWAAHLQWRHPADHRHVVQCNIAHRSLGAPTAAAAISRTRRTPSRVTQNLIGGGPLAKFRRRYARPHRHQHLHGRHDGERWHPRYYQRQRHRHGPACSC